MYRVVIDVGVDASREEEARNMLINMIVPLAKTHQGIVSGHWLRASHIVQGKLSKLFSLFYGLFNWC